MYKQHYASKIHFPEIVIKDYDFESFCKKYSSFDMVPKMKSIIDMLNLSFKHYLVNVTIKDYSVGDKTCVDTRYHVDGDYTKDNVYCLWCKGSNRTVFSKSSLENVSMPNERMAQNIFLENLLKDSNSYEVDDQTIYRYTSKDPHKGVICKVPGNRIFVRVMGTNYLTPKNYIQRKHG